MSRTFSMIAAVTLWASGSAFAAPNAPETLPLDTETQVGGVELACTGIGADLRNEARWQRYGVRVEFSNARNEYLVSGLVTVRDRSGQARLSVRCDAPWLLLRLPPGAYVIEGRLADVDAKPRTAKVAAPASGQVRVVLQFPDV